MTEKDWWSVDDSATDRDDEAEDRAELADAAADLRYAAEMMRDASAPPLPEKESNWDFSWFTTWIRHSSNGRAFKWAAVTVAPLWMFFLTTQKFPLLTAVGMTGLGFVITGGWHLHAERKVTRIVVWGIPLGLIYYTPVAVVFGLAGILVGG